MSTRGVSEPYTIATLPKPLDAERGRIRSAPTYNLTRLGKRKRNEIVVGIDGEAVNVYNVNFVLHRTTRYVRLTSQVEHQNTVASYPVPPQSYLAAAPCSIYCRSSPGVPPQRRTYLAVRDGSSEKRLRLVSYIEDLGQRKGQQLATRTTNKSDRKLRQVDVLGVEPLPNLKDGQSQFYPAGVLIMYKNGSMDCIADDLSGTMWEYTASDSEPVEVAYSTICTLETARKGLLKGREDVLAVLDARASRGSSLLVCQVVGEEQRRRFRIMTLDALQSSASRAQRRPVEEIVSYDLPLNKRRGAGLYELHPAAGYLYQHVGTYLALYNLTGTTPRLSFELGRKKETQVRGFAHISAASVLAVSAAGLAVYETNFGSVLGSSPKLFNSPKGDAHDEEHQDSLPRDICYFSGSGLMVARHNTDLVCFQLGEELSRKRKIHSSLLADATGQSHDILPLRVLEMKPKNSRRWEEWRTRVDELAASAKTPELERLVANDIHLHEVQNTVTATVSSAKGETVPEDYTWNLRPYSWDADQVDAGKAIHLLGKIFAWRSASASQHDPVGQGRLAVVLKSPNLMRWLAMAGYLEPRLVQFALASGTAGQVFESDIVPGAIMAALYEIDPDFVLIRELISLPVDWDIAEITQALSLLIRSINTSAEDEAQLAITNSSSDDDIAMTDGDADSQFEIEVAAAAQELDYASAIFDHGIRVRGETLNLLMTRLKSFAKDDIVHAMRTILSTEDITFMMAILRIELRDGGWTSRHVEEGLDETQVESPSGLGNAEHLSSSEQALQTIATLLNYCIDAVGVSGWLVGRSGDDAGTEALIETVRAEVSAALEGCFEADTLGRCLNDLARFSRSDDVQHKQRKMEDEFTPAKALMPLGGRTGPPEVKTLFGRDVKKSRAAQAEERSRAVGKYTFERIRF